MLIAGKVMTTVDAIGWCSAIILLPTFGVQVYKQWASRREPASVSSLWFFAMALVGTGGQAVYSWLVDNAVYLALNLVLVVTNGIGLAIDIYRWCRWRRGPGVRATAGD
jgi:uncharacterized protein with PQ loop repeat